MLGGSRAVLASFGVVAAFGLVVCAETQCINPNQTVSQVTNLVSTDSGCGGTQHYDVGYNVTDNSTSPPTVTYISIETDVLVPALCAGNWYNCQCTYMAQYTQQSNFTPNSILENPGVSLVWDLQEYYISGYDYNCSCSDPCPKNASNQVLLYTDYPNYIDQLANC